MQPSGKKVLVVDDDSSIRSLICTLIRREKIAVDGVSDGAEAIAALESNDYAVILLDLMMPRLDGFGVIGHLKEHPPELKPIVFVISAYGDHAYKRVDADVVTGIIHKPFDVDAIGSLIRQCVDGEQTQLPSEVRSARIRAIRDFDQFIEWTGRDKTKGS